MPRKMRNVPAAVHHEGHPEHGYGGLGILLLVLGIIGFAIEYGYVSLPFWPTLLVVAGLWKLLIRKR